MLMPQLINRNNDFIGWLGMQRVLLYCYLKGIQTYVLNSNAELTISKNKFRVLSVKIFTKTGRITLLNKISDK